MKKGLYNIAYNRKSSLYDSIKDKKILDWLNHFCDAALNMNLFAFLHYIIDILDIRSILRAANGENSDDVLDELLNLASEFKRSHNHNLQEFVIWLEMREIEIKRNTISDDNVKIMTIHASKGLESPIVMLVDTTSLPTSQNHFLWQDDLLLWPGTSKNLNSFYQKYNALSLEKNYQEYMRLLYVAMTRAEDHLIIAGIKPKGEASEKSWYSIIAESLDKMPISKENDIIYYGNHHIIDKKKVALKLK
ncbi:MAG UNVERIFIED_CONTAM: hypothetical protein LVQ98_05835 [Rickettsiaceae bacterium]|jgi:ATP-dependent helicase/nuclease subunit A